MRPGFPLGIHHQTIFCQLALPPSPCIFPWSIGVSIDQPSHGLDILLVKFFSYPVSHVSLEIQGGEKGGRKPVNGLRGKGCLTILRTRARGSALLRHSCEVLGEASDTQPHSFKRPGGRLRSFKGWYQMWF